LLLLFAFAVRVLTLGQQSIWFDEGWSWHLAKMPLAEMALTTAGDRSPPLYYALLHGWIALAGQSEFAMRFISVLADVATVALVIALTRLLTRSRSAALAAGVLYALNPFAIWYAQEVRQYALVAALCTASTLFLVKWLSQMGNGEWRMENRSVFRIPHSPLLISAIALALAVYCHYYAIFLLPAHFLVVLIAIWQSKIENRKSKILKWFIAAFCVALSVVPWLLVASSGFAYDDGFFFPLNTVDGRLLEWWRGFAAGGITRPLPEWWSIALIIPMLIGAIALLLMPRKQPWPNWARLLMLLALIAGPLLAATVAVRVVYPYRSVFHVRYLIYVAPAACVLIGAAFTQLQITNYKVRAVYRPSSIALSMALLAALWLPVLMAYFTEPAYGRDDTRGAVKHVVEALEPGDAVVMTRDNFAVRYYWPADKTGTLIAMPAGLHGILKDDRAILAALNAAQPRRVRLMLWQDDVVDPQKFVESSLWPHAFELGEFNFAQIRLPLYAVEQLPIASPAFTQNDAVFDGKLQLNSHWLRRAGDWFYVVLNWQPVKTIAKDYKVFVHVRDASGTVVFQNDKLPLNELLPMTRWQAGVPLRDAHAMVIPKDLPAGAYQVVAGVYDPLTNERLRTASGADFVSLGEVQIER
jgi:uncharacterized membrane protein